MLRIAFYLSMCRANTECKRSDGGLKNYGIGRNFIHASLFFFNQDGVYLR